MTFKEIRKEILDRDESLSKNAWIGPKSICEKIESFMISPLYILLILIW